MTTLDKINKAIEALQTKGTKPTQKNVSTETGLSVRTIKRHWANRVTDIKPEQVNRVTLTVKKGDTDKGRVTPNSTLSAFERLKRRKPVEEVLPYRPWLKS